MELISLTKGDPMLGGEYYVFKTAAYAPTDLVPVSRSPHATESHVSFQAHYLITGEHL
jgi:hypothetical protein